MVISKTKVDYILVVIVTLNPSGPDPAGTRFALISMTTALPLSLSPITSLTQAAFYYLRVIESASPPLPRRYVKNKNIARCCNATQDASMSLMTNWTEMKVRCFVWFVVGQRSRASGVVARAASPGESGPPALLALLQWR